MNHLSEDQRKTPEQIAVESAKRLGMQQRLYSDCSSNLFQARQCLERAEKDTHRDFEQEIKTAMAWINVAVALHNAWKETSRG